MGFLNTFSRILGATLRETLLDQVRLESLEDANTLTLKDGTLMSLISLEGSMHVLGTVDLEEVAERIRVALSAYLTFPGHAIEFTFVRDPSAAREQLDRIVRRSGRAARDLGLDLDDVLEERTRTLPDYLCGERCLVAVYTRPVVLGKSEQSQNAREVTEQLSGAPSMLTAQMPGKIFSGVYTRHQALTEAVNRDFRDVGQLSRILGAREALQEIRACLYPLAEKGAWQPRLPAWAETEVGAQEGVSKAATMVMMPDSAAELEASDFANLGVPTLDRQLASETAQTIDLQTVRIGDTLCSGFDLTLAPEVITPFDTLVRQLHAAGRRFPWRCSILLESGGLQAFRLKEQYTRIFAFAAPTRNRRIRDTIERLRDVDGVSDTVVRMRMSFASWAPVGRSEDLRRQTAILKQEVQRWGVCQVDAVTGDQLATVLSTVPGISPGSTAPVAAAPLSQALCLGPLSRQASPWETGAVLFRLPDGKLWPYQPGSSKQTSWVDIFCGTPGSGKSVAMNALNFACALAPNAGADEVMLPRIGIIDIGYSSAGLISLLQEALPASRRHEVAHRRLKMTAANAINPFDTQLGMRKPASADRQFLANFLVVLCSDGAKPPPSSMIGLIGATIDQAYQALSDRASPRRYVAGDEVEVDRALVETGFGARDGAIWWEAVDHLMRHGRPYEAEVAQRHAVPLLADLVTATTAEQVTALYASANDPTTAQPLIQSFQRILSEVTRDYAVLSTYTRFAINARICALDLGEVTVRGAGEAAQKQTAIMYMLARHVIAKDFFVDEDEIRAAVRSGSLPRVYENHHLERARANRQMPKRLCLDEYHRTGGIPGIQDQVIQDTREGRKHNLQIALASQLPGDFSPAVLKMASSVFVCNAPSKATVEELAATFGFGELEQHILQHELTGPTPQGAPMVVNITLKEGVIRQKLVLTLGPAELWALSTTAEDVALRSALYETLGPRMARQILAKRFPSGSAKAEIEARIARLEEQGERLDERGRGNVVSLFAQELEQQAASAGLAAN